MSNQIWNHCYDNEASNSAQPYEYSSNEWSKHFWSPINHQLQNQLATSPSTPYLPTPHHYAFSFTDGYDRQNVPTMKRKRVRTTFTAPQINLLEAQYQKNPYASAQIRAAFSYRLGINEKVVKVWFQNRRFKEKRQEREREESWSPHSSVAHRATDPSQTTTPLPNGFFDDAFLNVEKIISPPLPNGGADDLLNDINDIIITELNIVPDR
ncbi:unnamed protein product [Diatraea saccharalis]|uniref:Homeobox domain-containing protein n=1 Tax=Diatraea saccharalis TaxID=40085 RepID=A0A9N9R0T7_9NEOP|nr:unnamed protein product [Diatraea saccharalis]